MIDFLMISKRRTKDGIIEIYPKFTLIKKSTDLMIRGGDFYAIWDEDKKLWSTDEHDLIHIIDSELDRYSVDHRSEIGSDFRILHLWDTENRMIERWHKFCKSDCRDNFHMLDERLIFSNEETVKEDYASKKLDYPLVDMPIDAWNELVGTLYSEDERRKIEWSIGAVVSGDSRSIQKFMVFYGSAGSGKSTILNIIARLFKGYVSVFDAKALGSSSQSFALEPFKNNPLVAIQQDGDLSRIEDNTRLNSLVSHEMMTVNEKFRSLYENSFKCFLYMGTNKPVRITDAKSGLIRRLIDVSPSGNKIPFERYTQLIKMIEFELGGIASHCLKVYQENPNAYDDYIPVNMMGASNDFYDFMVSAYMEYDGIDEVSLTTMYERYNKYCERANVQFKLPQRVVREELKTYYKKYYERKTLPDGTRVRSWYSKFDTSLVDGDLNIISEESVKKEVEKDKEVKEDDKSWLIFDKKTSIFDTIYTNNLAQYASSDKNEAPLKPWDDVETVLGDIDTSKTHYVLPSDQQLIMVDFDIPDENGKKCREKNLEAASTFPKTYGEYSKSGEGVHLYYIYAGDVDKLSRIFDEHIEVKVLKGKSAIRRRLSLCNDIPIATIGSGLPLKGEMKDKLVDLEILRNEKTIRNLILRAITKEWGSTKQSIDFIFKILDDAYTQKIEYDVTDLYNAVLGFALNSTNQSQYCLDKVAKMHFKSDDIPDPSKFEKGSRFVFFDVEIFPNLFLLCWKYQGDDEVHILINPEPHVIEVLIQEKLIGFNCRRYDNHILYARMIGYSIEQLYLLSQAIINGKKDAFFGNAYNVSYTDIYDFSATKQSLKKFEIELSKLKNDDGTLRYPGIIHKELGFQWDKPVPEDKWELVASYCKNDVVATEYTFDFLKSDFLARQILADIAGMTPNDTTNSLTTRIIFGKEKNPQAAFNYRDMSRKPEDDPRPIEQIFGCDEYSLFYGSTPIFPGYKYENGVSTYRGEVVGEGGYVYAEPGMYGNIALLDIASMHPSSIRAEDLFGPEYTKRFNMILDARVAIKHGEYEKASTMFDGKLAKYLSDKSAAKNLAQALKIAINSVYGLTSATFANPFKDPRNFDNIVAKRGALFMINLKHEVQSRGGKVVHIKTDSIKIADATDDIMRFVMDYGKHYGYNFEHEATYEKMCLVNNAVYIAQYRWNDKEGDSAYGRWTATGTQFQVPYVFKSLFSKEPIEFFDMCETKSVTSALYLDHNESLPDVSMFEKELKKLKKDRNKLLLEKKPENDQLVNDISSRIEELKVEIAKGHDYEFIGKIGLFCPMISGVGAGILMRDSSNGLAETFAAPPGTDGYRWMESSTVKALGLEDKIDKSYYVSLVDEAVADISKYGDFEWFASDEPYNIEAITA